MPDRGLAVAVGVQGLLFAVLIFAAGYYIGKRA